MEDETLDKARVFDYVDPTPVLVHAAKSRQRVYGGINPEKEEA